MEAGRQVFSVDLLERYATKGRGIITCMSAGNDVIVLGTSKGWIIRHDFGVGDSYDIDLSVGRPGEQSIHRVFVDPGGSHCIATVVGGGGADTFYTHAKWNKPRILGKLKGLVVNAVAWNRQQITEASTREVILGTDNGQLHEISVDEKDKREKHINFLFELKELPEPFTSLQMETASTSNGTRYYVMAVTPTRLYSFTGIGSLDAVFSSYLNRPVRFMELPGEIPNSELHFFMKQRRAVHFAWLSGAGIYHGGLHFGAQHSSSDGDENFVENKGLLVYSKLGEGADAVKPSSLAVSEFHFLLLLGNKVKVVNRISEQIIEELQFDQIPESMSKGIIGLCTDASAGLFYAYDQNSIFQVSVNDEGRDMWKVYLELKAYAAALANCRDPFQRDQVNLAQAEAAFADKDFLRAASFYAKINYILSFEEITLKFISINEQDPLRTFLLRKLDNLAKDDKCQVTMISTWATELYLDKINRLLLEDDSALENRSSEYHSIIREFRAFLADCKDVLDEATTMKLLESYGRVDELVYFASLKEQYEIVIHHYIQQGEAKKGLEVLQKPSVPVDLQYKFAPDLIMLDAYETVESWMTTKDLNPRKLIPAMMRYSSEPHAKNETHEVIKYLEFCVHRLQNEDPGIHNLLLSLYAKQEDDSTLLRFLQCKFGKGGPSSPEFFYDPKYALRLCLKEKRMRACVHIYSMMSMHEEAVALALQVDPELAKAEADKVEDDEDLRKKLWLMVAKHVVEQEKGTKRENIRKAIAFLKETDGLLKIEDILPFFPDFVLIDDFKEAICTSLEDYNKQIEQLKEEMNDATHGADNIRNDINALAQRYAVINRDEDCGVCQKKILTAGWDQRMARGYAPVGAMAPFYVFPCGHTFHAQCLIAHVTRCTDHTQAEYILDLQRQLTLLGGEFKDSNAALNVEESITTMTRTDKIRSQLDDAIASECPFCGELMIREISLPFILPDEAYEATTWEIKPQNVGTQKSISLVV
ncbi:vacuolar sorting protein 18 isoform X1 [Diospyros lotus]|uniref:vacuolar sorting protein 18 isoform X1 n=2 Tax=Diospyros lotus TaxID=55363 RepID=UPI00224D4B83|nr:vacuolar sorting protein 18 isoform X1 [Diospyros lotus]XP_052198986.1 vacuolar sorting protein 18 isoform X1 [Diospyros lotus]XP_052198987.1 vacuolar sorting protein 18 isoform X1 [Diospyros lotus]XP_052198988.1 vacuolar sorting protein 18 isoform X1 [Diospyros lotus]